MVSPTDEASEMMAESRKRAVGHEWSAYPLEKLRFRQSGGVGWDFKNRTFVALAIPIGIRDVSPIPSPKNPSPGASYTLSFDTKT
ncbi:hypothetical protein M427DRAFT_212249 [Gonapodya prolifera JEL478]|uniref:Uncharacterized protein n=1 Tax=Gonapodya prolifera (strain JEL478) TaxID=1344416 RepID=A0A139APV1_GONPJ|nr:hypothetical protein M427DRAFT_212249 [Gonapodya prolifera JEL478]|eukprot:KXS18515.1 hypothetical protein M427DRAFT_212249 [Gonapodya prolifera JEL478]